MALVFGGIAVLLMDGMDIPDAQVGGGCEYSGARKDESEGRTHGYALARSFGSKGEVKERMVCYGHPRKQDLGWEEYK